MRIGLAAWGFRETSLERQLACCSEMGLKLLELSVAGTGRDLLQLDAGADKISKVKGLFESSGVELSCAATGNDFTGADEASCLKSLDNVKRVIDICAKLGVKQLRIFAGFSPLAEVAGERWDRMAECLRRSYAHASGTGVEPAIETHGGVESVPAGGVRHIPSASTSSGSIARMLEEVPGLKLNFDPANLLAVGVEHPEELYLKFKKSVSYAHLKDFAPHPTSGGVVPAACGEGPMDWAALLKAMKGYQGPALIEYENAEDVEEGSLRSLRFLERALASQGFKLN